MLAFGRRVSSNPANVGLAKSLIARLKTHARLIARYDQDMVLYQILPGDLPQ